MPLSRVRLAAVALLQRGRDDKEKQHIAYKVVPACMPQHMTEQPDKKQRIGQRRAVDAEKMIGCPPVGQMTERQRSKRQKEKGQRDRGVVLQMDIAALHGGCASFV